MELGETLTFWTARISLALYLLALVLRLTAGLSALRLAAAKWTWTAAYGIFLLHLAAAFQYFHHWSHDAAYETTARQTEEVIGLNWGGGIFINHFFALVWGLDVAWWWLAPARYLTRPRWIEWLIQGFMAFIAFNATVVFGHGPIRWAGVVGSLILAGALVWRAARRQPAVH